jgi:hypothetical protein
VYDGIRRTFGAREVLFRASDCPAKVLRKSFRTDTQIASLHSSDTLQVVQLFDLSLRLQGGDSMGEASPKVRVLNELHPTFWQGDCHERFAASQQSA